MARLVTSQGLLDVTAARVVEVRHRRARDARGDKKIPSPLPPLEDCAVPLPDAPRVHLLLEFGNLLPETGYLLPETRIMESDHCSHTTRWRSRGSFFWIFEHNVTIFALHSALNLITLCKMTVDGNIVLDRLDR